MRKLISNKAFVAGFIGGVLVFLGINAFIFIRTCCKTGSQFTGFPFIFWEEYFGNPSLGLNGELIHYNYEHFYVFNLVADILITVIFSFLIGLICQFVWSIIASRRVKLK